jgi:exodeoxyribonuclease V alpha subunit
LYNQNNKLPYDLIIVDEISMVGGEIFYSLIRAIENGTKLIMLGDVSQLESIGYLNLFRDMMDSGVIVTSHLNKIHRQAAKSAIITSSMHVRNQMQLFPKNYSGQKVMGDLQDLEVDIYEDSIITQRKIVKHYTTLLEKGIHKNDIQVIVPMKTRGDISTFALNPLLQKVANPNLFDYIVRKKRVGSNDVENKIGVNDRVINVSNHYDTFNLDGDTVPVYNGNMGIVVQISEEEAVVDFYQWGKIVIPKTYFNDLELAYAITGHKLQGSESPYTIIGLDMSAYMMLTKEWLYTAITRARKYCVLCAQNAAVSMAINTSRVPYKQTLLKQMLNGKSYFDTKKITKVQERIIESENSNWL